MSFRSFRISPHQTILDHARIRYNKGGSRSYYMKIGTEPEVVAANTWCEIDT